MRLSVVSACLASAMCAGMAVAQAPVAYVYVAEDTSYTNGSVASPITAYAASPDGKLTPLPGSPFTQTSGIMYGTNGTHFITLDENNTSHEYLRVYNVASNGVIGEEVSKQDLHEWCGNDGPAEFDHTGQFIYVLESNQCGGGYLSFALSKSGQLTFKGSFSDGLFYNVPTFSGNDKFAYTFVQNPESQEPCPTDIFLGMGRESSGALENISFSETDPAAPAGYEVVQAGIVTDDPTNHLASMVYFNDGPCGQSGESPFELASYTVQSSGDLVSTNTYEDMPQVDDLGNGQTMKLNAAGNILAVTTVPGIQFFHFNGAAPITPFPGTGVPADPDNYDYISTLTWDAENHLYAFDQRSGKLHVYTATTTSVVEAPGSPYTPPNSCAGPNGCAQTLIVRRIP